jgi:hypothetical protein
MNQNIENKENQINNQVNITENQGSIYLTKKTRFSKRFEKLNSEVANNERFAGILDDLKYYITKLDGIDMPTKLNDGGFSSGEILAATRKKEKYAKKLEKNKFFESAQWIDSQLFAKIKMDFETYVEKPLIYKGASKDIILKTIVEKVITPILDLINIEGENDEILNYNAEDIFGMIYYLTGKCHINWKDYDSI